MKKREPNLQNIPIRTETGKRIREAFQEPLSPVTENIDYSDLEHRMAAMLGIKKKDQYHG